MAHYFDDVEVNDLVYDLGDGEGIVTNIVTENLLPDESPYFTVIFNLDPTTEYKYHFSGVRFESIYQTLYYLNDKPEIIPQHPIKEYHLKGGEFRVTDTGTVIRTPSNELSKEFGVERISEELAVESMKIMRNFNRILALRDELCSDSAGYIFNKNLPNYFILFRFLTNTYVVEMDRYYFSPFTVYFKTENDANLVAQMLNEKEFPIEIYFSDENDPAYFENELDLPLENSESGSGS
jgi:hypothetical protein